VRQTVLLVEDQTVVAMDIGEVLSEVGYDVAASAVSLDEALAHAWRRRFHAAVLSVELGRRSSIPVADCLADFKVPVLFISNHPRDALPARHRDRPFVQKPFDARELVLELGRLTGVLAPPTPAEGERRMDALAGAELRVVRLQTQVARLELLTERYPMTDGLRLLALLRDSLDAAIDHRDRLRRDSAGR
jgi:DNA-binding response OmpR family regulator